MLGNGVTPAAGAAEPLWQAELPNLARNINLNPKKLKCNQFTTRVEVCCGQINITHKCIANGQNMSLSTAPVGWN